MLTISWLIAIMMLLGQLAMWLLSWLLQMEDLGDELLEESFTEDEKKEITMILE